MPSLTWIFDTRFRVDVAVSVDDGAPVSVKDRRVMINSGGGARLYSSGSTTPERRLEGVSYAVGLDDRWTVSGTNPATGDPEVWTFSKVVSPTTSACGSCGGRR